MTPRLELDDVGNDRSAYSEQAAQIFSGSLFGHLPNFSHLILCQFCSPIILALTNFRVFASATSITARWFMQTLVAKVIHILKMRSDKKVRRSNAYSIVAVVTNLHAGRYRSIVENPGKPVPQNISTVPMKIWSSITRSASQSRGPNPAISEVWHVRWYRSIFSNLFPESFLVRSGNVGLNLGVCDICGSICDRVHSMILVLGLSLEPTIGRPT
jgi:hypothetical protein